MPAPTCPPGSAWIGRSIGHGYVLRELLGTGASGTVYLAAQPALERHVAIKVLHPHLVADAANLARFEREARLASRLAHPNSVMVLDYGRTDEGIPFVVLEHLRGRSLREALREGERPSARDACKLVVEVLSALSDAHALGIVHRDLKPENVFVVRHHDGTEQAKVVDFGIARLANGGADEPACGTAPYVAPEVWLGEGIDARTDLYAVGAVLFELLVGRTPFLGDDAQQLFAHLVEPPPSPRALAPQAGISAAVEAIVLRALAKSPAERFASADAMAAALATALQGFAPPPKSDEEGPPSWLALDLEERAPRERSRVAALAMLERSATRALAEGSVDESIRDFQAALALARRSLLETGETLFESAIVSFSLELAAALRRSRRFDEAWGVLEEALATSATRGSQRARCLVALGHVALERDRPRQALLFARRAVELVDAETDRRIVDDAKLLSYRARVVLGHSSIRPPAPPPSSPPGGGERGA